MADDEDVPALSAEAFAALHEFYAEQNKRQEIFDKLQAEDKLKENVLFDENWVQDYNDWLDDSDNNWQSDDSNRSDDDSYARWSDVPLSSRSTRSDGGPYLATPQLEGSGEAESSENLTKSKKKRLKRRRQEARLAMLLEQTSDSVNTANVSYKKTKRKKTKDSIQSDARDSDAKCSDPPPINSVTGTCLRRLPFWTSHGYTPEEASIRCRRPYIEIPEYQALLDTDKEGSFPLKKRLNSSDITFEEPKAKTKPVSDTECIKVGIIDDNCDITNDMVKNIEKEILQYVDSSTSSGPKFTQFTVRSGCLILTCRNKDTRDWLENHIDSFTPWKGASLRLIDQDEISKVNLALAFFSKKIPIKTLMHRLTVQNKTIGFDKWKVLSVKQTIKGQIVFFAIDNTSLTALQNATVPFHIFLGLQTVQVKIKSKQEPPRTLPDLSSCMLTSKPKHSETAIALSAKHYGPKNQETLVSGTSSSIGITAKKTDDNQSFICRQNDSTSYSLKDDQISPHSFSQRNAQPLRNIGQRNQSFDSSQGLRDDQNTSSSNFFSTAQTFRNNNQKDQNTSNTQASSLVVIARRQLDRAQGLEDHQNASPFHSFFESNALLRSCRNIGQRNQNVDSSPDSKDNQNAFSYFSVNNALPRPPRNIGQRNRHSFSHACDTSDYYNASSPYTVSEGNTHAQPANIDKKYQSAFASTQASWPVGITRTQFDKSQDLKDDQNAPSPYSFSENKALSRPSRNIGQRKQNYNSSQGLRDDQNASSLYPFSESNALTRPSRHIGERNQSFDSFQDSRNDQNASSSYSFSKSSALTRPSRNIGQKRQRDFASTQASPSETQSDFTQRFKDGRISSSLSKSNPFSRTYEIDPRDEDVYDATWMPPTVEGNQSRSPQGYRDVDIMKPFPSDTHSYPYPSTVPRAQGFNTETNNHSVGSAKNQSGGSKGFKSKTALTSYENSYYTSTVGSRAQDDIDTSTWPSQTASFQSGDASGQKPLFIRRETAISYEITSKALNPGTRRPTGGPFKTVDRSKNYTYRH